MATDQELTDLYSSLRASLLARHFAVSKFFRGNHYTLRNTLATGNLNKDQVLALSLEEQQLHRWRREFFDENPLLFGGQVMACIAVEAALDPPHPHAERIIRSWLSTLRSLYKFRGNHFDGYILRWDPATSEHWTLDATGPRYSNHFLRDPNNGSYQFSPSHADPRHVPFRASEWLQQTTAQREADRYIERQSQDNLDFRRWEPSMDELVGLVAGYYVLHRLTRNAGNRQEIARQVNRLGDYLAEHAYLLVRPNGGLTARGSTGILPSLEYPFMQAMQFITGRLFTSRKNFQGVMEKAGYWNNLAGPLARWTALGFLAAPVIDAIEQFVLWLTETTPLLLILQLTGNPPAWVRVKGADLMQRLLTTNSIAMARIAAIAAHRDCFDLSNDDAAQEVAIGFALKENFAPPESFRLWMYGTSFRGTNEGGWAQGFPPFVGLTGLDGDPLVGEVYQDWYRERQLHVELEPLDRTRAFGCFAGAVALLHSADPNDESTLKERLDRRYEELSAAGADLPLVMQDGAVVEISFRTALDFMSGLALAWLYRKRQESAGRPVSTNNFPALPQGIHTWNEPAVPIAVVDEWRADVNKRFLVGAIQRNSNNLMAGPRGVPLFLESNPPVKPELTAPPLDTEPNTLVLERTIVVRERDRDVYVGVLQNGDVYSFEASGTIWAGVGITGRNRPDGWDTITWDARFPLHGGIDPDNAHPFCLLGRHYGGYFFIGEGGQRQRYILPYDVALWLRINDDAPGNGNGSFTVHARVWGEPRHEPAGYRIESVDREERQYRGKSIQGRIIFLYGSALLHQNDSDGAAWQMSTREVIRSINRGQFFFVQGSDGSRAKVGVVGNRYVRTFHDNAQGNNLSNLG